MIELLTLLTDKDKYYRFKPYIKDYTLPKEARQILHDLDEYYTFNPTITNIDIDKFSMWFSVLKHSAYKPATLEIYHEIFKNIKEHISAPKSSTDEDIVEHFIQRDYATRMADLSLKIAEGDTSVSLSECENILEQYGRESKRAALKEETLVTASIEDLVITAGSGLDWRLDELNKSLGPLRKGNFIVVGKLPESGGTAFCISEATFMLQQIEAEQKILYFGNEETGESIRRRVASAILEASWDKIEKYKAVAAGEFVKNRGDDIEIHNMQGRSMRDIERIIKRSNPALIIIDQLWKVHGYEKSASEVSKINNLFAKARELAAEYAPVIAVHQADGTAWNDVYLGMDQLYMSRIGIQGEADAIVMLGVSSEPGMEKKRFINVPKNKLSGGKLSEEQYRHSKWEVEIIPELSQYKSCI